MSESGILFVQALTGLHPGSGTALGVVDLPVQRERHTGWPMMPGSSLKGVLRDTCRRASDDRDMWLAAFGPETGEAHDHAGALSVTDARILAFPVRSLNGVFAWVTCPAVLQRLARDAALLGGGAAALSLPPPPNLSEALTPEGSPLLVDGNRLLLEELEFSRTGACGEATDWVAARALADDATRERFGSHCAVLHDDDFTHFVQHATEVMARVGLDYERKTVRGGALFYEEFLPPETLFYAVILAQPSRRKGRESAAADILDYVSGHLPPVLQIGADETIGRGFCAVRLETAGRA